MNKLVARLSLPSVVLALFCCAAHSQTREIVASETQLSPTEQQMVDWIAGRQDQMLDELKTHVDINTGTDNIAGIDRYRQLLTVELKQLGFVTQEYLSAPLTVLSCSGGAVAIANHLVGTRQGAKPNRILLNGHMDTVFSSEDQFQSLVVDPDGTLRGPGVGDMKGGIVVMLNALRALNASGRLDGASITILFNSDEEIGSLGSRPLVERLAREHDIGFVFEGSEDNRFTRARKGLGQARVRVSGRESHAGAAHERGVSATLELAHKIIAIEKLTDYDRKNTVNVGVMRGGEKRNTVPGCADAYVDLRYPTAEEGLFLAGAIEQIGASTVIANPEFPGLPTTEVWTSLHRPVKPANPQVDALIAEAMGLSLLIGQPIAGTRYSGGGTDGSIAQAVGLPTIDSVGLDSHGIHSSRERTTVASLLARTQLAAVMLGRQIDKE
jgi:glutamate carboxypeptidase